MPAKHKKPPTHHSSSHASKKKFFVSSHDAWTAEVVAAVVCLAFLFMGLGYALRGVLGW